MEVDVSRRVHVPDRNATILQIKMNFRLIKDIPFRRSTMWVVVGFSTLEHVTIIPLLNRRCKTASQWWMSVLTISPDFTSQTRTVESLDPLIMTFSSYWRHRTDPVCPVSTCNHTRFSRHQLTSQINQTITHVYIFFNLLKVGYCTPHTFVHWSDCLSQILMVLSRSPDTIFESSYCKQ